MAAMPPDAGSPTVGETPPAVAPGVGETQRQARYNHLVTRLRGRQITMEEATELFGMMQAQLRASEAARRAAQTAAAPALGPNVARVVHPREGASSAPDDLFLVGLLAMGAGAGLLAAMARRLGDPAAASPPANPGSAARRST